MSQTSLISQTSLMSLISRKIVAERSGLCTYRGLNEQNSQKSVIVYNEPCAHLYHFKFKEQSFSLPTNIIVALNICLLFLMIVSKLILFN